MHRENLSALNFCANSPYLGIIRLMPSLLRTSATEPNAHQHILQIDRALGYASSRTSTSASLDLRGQSWRTRTDKVALAYEVRMARFTPYPPFDFSSEAAQITRRFYYAFLFSCTFWAILFPCSAGSSRGLCNARGSSVMACDAMFYSLETVMKVSISVD